MTQFPKGLLEQRPDYLVCTCMGVMYSEICQTIKNGAITYEQLSEQLLVGTGCNSCVAEVKAILQEQLNSK